MDARRFAVHRVGEGGEPAPKILDNALEAQAHAKDGQIALQRRIERLREIEIFWFPRTRGQDNQVGLAGLKLARGKPGAQGEDFGAGLTQIIGQGVDKGVLMIDQQDFLIPTNRSQGRALFRGTATRPADRVEKGRGFDVGFFLFRLRVGVVQQSCAGPDWATPSFRRMVRSVRPVFRLPLNPIRPTAPPYQARGDFSWSSINCMAQALERR